MTTEKESGTTHHILIIKHGSSYSIRPRTLYAEDGDKIILEGINTGGLKIHFPDSPDREDVSSFQLTADNDYVDTFAVGGENNVYPYAVYSEKERDFVGFCRPPAPPEDGCFPPSGGVQYAMDVAYSTGSTSISSGPVIIVYNGYG